MDTEIVVKGKVDFPEHPWDIQHDESPMAYEAFITFRDLGIRRTLAAAAEKLGRTSPSQLHKWAAERKWMMRVRAYDIWLDKIKQKEHEDAIRTMSKRQAEIGIQMQDLAAARIQDFASSPDLRETMSSRDAVHLAVEGVKIERLARGKATEHVDHGLKLILPMIPSWAPGAVKAAAEAEDKAIEGEAPKLLQSVIEDAAGGQ